MSGNEHMYWRPLAGEIMTHPEVELRTMGDFVNKIFLRLSRPTVMDIVEIYLNRLPVIHKKIGESGFKEYLESSEKQTQEPSLRIIFLDYINQSGIYSHLLGHSQDESSDDIARLMHQRYQIPLNFFRYVKDDNGLAYAETSRSSFIHKSQDGVNISVDGMYQSQFANTSFTHSCYVWFSQSLALDLKSRTCNYVIHGNVPHLKNYIFACANGGGSGFLLRPFAIDAFIQDICIKSLHLGVVHGSNDRYVHENRYVGDSQPPSEVDEIARLLMSSARMKFRWASMNMCTHTITYLMATLERHRDQFAHEGSQTSYESLALVNERAKDLMLYNKVLDERIRIQIDIAYNHASRQDNQVNIRIAQLTSKIAIAAQQDSSAMITMAAVTMFFLPGTFVSALFSMVFFTMSTSSDGGAGVLTISSKWWIYFAITIPLTALVFLTWHIWRRHRTARAMNALEDLHLSDVEPESATEESISHPELLPRAFGGVRRRILGLRKILNPSVDHDLEQGLGDEGGSNEVKGSKAE